MIRGDVAQANWKIIGVVGIDVTTCDLEKKLFDANPLIQQAPRQALHTHARLRVSG